MGVHVRTKFGWRTLYNTRYKRITKRAWVNLGGLSHPDCFRRQSSSGVWQYFIIQM